jgi:MinD-like ATPase involved in chromosome partitioning or flagellar assembly
VVTVTGDQDTERPLRVVERALGNPSGRRGSGWHDHVVVVPGGHRPGRPDQLQRDRARARLPVRGGHRVVVLGCTVGAGQTVTALLIGELLVSLRGDEIAVLDLNSGDGSLAERARAVPALTGSRPPAPSRAEVITREAAGAGSGAEFALGGTTPLQPPAAEQAPRADIEDVTRVFELVSARYPLTLADPGAAAVPRVLAAADQLVLVAPASQDAASALATTREWLEAHGHAELADRAIVVLNGVSRHTMPHVEQAEALARGRCRAIVRIPWDDHLKYPGSGRSTSPAPPARPAAGPLTPAALHAYTALSGVLIAALATAPVLTRGVTPGPPDRGAESPGPPVPSARAGGPALASGTAFGRPPGAPLPSARAGQGRPSHPAHSDGSTPVRKQAGS